MVSRESSPSTTAATLKSAAPAFTLDTTGEVLVSIALGVPAEVAGGYRWKDLSPFVQGYLRAAFEGLRGEATPAITAALADVANHDSRARNQPLLRECGKALRERCHWSGTHSWPATCDKLREIGLVIVVMPVTSLTAGPVSEPTELGRAVSPFLLGFSDLAPEALAAVLRDCERYRGRTSSSSGAVGALFWMNRSGGHLSGDGWSPLSPFLGDDGKVRGLGESV